MITFNARGFGIHRKNFMAGFEQLAINEVGDRASGISRHAGDGNTLLR